MTHELWYKNGLKFGCKQCGRCCIGEAGYVWVSEDEIAAMAQHLKLDRATFSVNFVRNVGNKKSLIELSNGDCIFYNANIKGCKLYKNRPVQCQTWPFWDSNIDTSNSWKKTAKFCPGCNAGELHLLDEIEARRKKLTL